MTDPIENLAMLEQGREALLNMAKLLGDYYCELKKSGIPAHEALVLVRDYQQMLLGRPHT